MKPIHDCRFYLFYILKVAQGIRGIEFGFDCVTMVVATLFMRDGMNVGVCIHHTKKQRQTAALETYTKHLRNRTGKPEYSRAAFGKSAVHTQPRDFKPGKDGASKERAF